MIDVQAANPKMTCWVYIWVPIDDTEENLYRSSQMPYGEAADLRDTMGGFSSSPLAI
jgi:hypothetical protein